MKDQVYIFDTTLRDGEQSPGASMNTDEKIRMALELEKLGVDVIEAGFPVSSKDEFNAVKRIAEEVRGLTVTGLARANPNDTDVAWQAIKDAEDPRLHIFLATSPIHREKKLKLSKGEVRNVALASVQYACQYTSNVEFSCEDATRTEIDFLCEIVRLVIKSGAKVVNLPDTVGYSIPTAIAELFSEVRRRVPETEDIILSTHCHNDMGMAVANSIAAIQNGVRQVECTINGIGERAGNASLEQIVMAIRTREDLLPFYTAVDSKRIYKASRALHAVTGLVVPRNLPIVGRNAFAHESGVHQDGVIKDVQTYEIMTPDSVGMPKSELVIGKHSGRRGIGNRCEDLGFSLTDEQLQAVYDKVKALADKKKEVFNDDLLTIIEEVVYGGEEHFKLVSPPKYNGGGEKAQGEEEALASVKIEVTDEGVKSDSAVGDGPIDAVFNAIDRVTGLNPEVVPGGFSINAVTSGRDATGEAFVKIKLNNMESTGRGASTDIIEAAAKAYIKAINRVMARQRNGVKTVTIASEAGG